MKKLILAIKKRKEIILYLFFGGCTTLVNIVCYFVLRKAEVNVTASTVISWIISVLFAYLVNKYFVFESKKTGLRDTGTELLSFFSGRLFTGILDLVIMVLFVDLLAFGEPPVKIASNIIVIVLNYILSKIWIFKK